MKALIKKLVYIFSSILVLCVLTFATLMCYKNIEVQEKQLKRISNDNTSGAVAFQLDTTKNVLFTTIISAKDTLKLQHSHIKKARHDTLNTILSSTNKKLISSFNQKKIDFYYYSTLSFFNVEIISFSKLNKTILFSTLIVLLIVFFTLGWILSRYVNKRIKNQISVETQETALPNQDLIFDKSELKKTIDVQNNKINEQEMTNKIVEEYCKKYDENIIKPMYDNYFYHKDRKYPLEGIDKTKYIEFLLTMAYSHLHFVKYHARGKQEADKFNVDLIVNNNGKSTVELKNFIENNQTGFDSPTRIKYIAQMMKESGIDSLKWVNPELYKIILTK